MKHAFTESILSILRDEFGALGDEVLRTSHLVQYLNHKTKSANWGSKSRGSFANHYALYVLVEDYIAQGYRGARLGTYGKYEGAKYSDLFRRQRELPFGAKLQNHALNSRLNDEFAKFFPTLGQRPLVRDLKEQRYWVNEGLIDVEIVAGNGKQIVNIAAAIIKIIDAYVAARRGAFERFIESCRKIAELEAGGFDQAKAFVLAQLQPNVDARVFEIVSYAILKAHYGEQSIFWGWNEKEVTREFLMLYKTGRTNANDGGIDFVMRPLGRFFQVTETIDSEKYFLDIDKVQRYPITFVVKTTDSASVLREALRAQALRKYRIDAVVTAYLASVEEIINITELVEAFDKVCAAGGLRRVMDEVVTQSRVEFNLADGEADDADAD